MGAVCVATAVTLVLLSRLTCSASAGLEDRQTVDDFLNFCLDTPKHKKLPSAEPKLADTPCKAWKDLSCCTGQTGDDIDRDGDQWYGLDLNHCGSVSEQCTHYFKLDTCHHECSPYLGPWAVDVGLKRAQERVYGAPLCQSECDNWWSSCKADKTCVPNWSKDFVWEADGPSYHNKCPKNATCRTIEEVYGNSTAFCQQVFDSSWRVVDDSQQCFKFALSSTEGGTNRQVARKRAQELVKAKSQVNSGRTLVTSLSQVLLVTCWASLVW